MGRYLLCVCDFAVHWRRNFEKQTTFSVNEIVAQVEFASAAFY